MKISIRYGSHLPVITKLMDITSGPVLELGVGLYSTPYLHYECFTSKRELKSYESDAQWVRFFRDCRNDYHEVHHIENWDNLEINQFWDVVLIDHNPENRRKEEAKRLANNAQYIILHDSDTETDDLYGYSEIYPLFKYRYDFTYCVPNTTVLSNFVDLSNLWQTRLVIS